MARRRTAAERREHVLDAAIAEFAASGYHAASTTAIARRAGISQPYIYALFPNKKALFMAAYSRVVESLWNTLAEAAQGAASPRDALMRMGTAFMRLLGEREELMCQLQGYAAAGDPEIRAHVRREFTALFDALVDMTGASREDVALFTAGGMFFTVAGALEVPQTYWPKPPYGEE
jgi:AcrR family transcriptional regulator